MYMDRERNEYFKEVELKLELGLVAEINDLAKAEQKRKGVDSGNMISEIIRKTDELLNVIE